MQVGSVCAVETDVGVTVGVGTKFGVCVAGVPGVAVGGEVVGAGVGSEVGTTVVVAVGAVIGGG